MNPAHDPPAPQRYFQTPTVPPAPSRNGWVQRESLLGTAPRCQMARTASRAHLRLRAIRRELERVRVADSPVLLGRPLDAAGRNVAQRAGARREAGGEIVRRRLGSDEARRTHGGLSERLRVATGRGRRSTAPHPDSTGCARAAGRHREPASRRAVPRADTAPPVRCQRPDRRHPRRGTPREPLRPSPRRKKKKAPPDYFEDVTDPKAGSGHGVRPPVGQGRDGGGPGAQRGK